MIDPPQVRPEEPTALTPHGGICGGESQQWLGYPTKIRGGGRGMRANRQPARAPAADDAIAGYGTSVGARWHLCLWRSPLQPGQRYPHGLSTLSRHSQECHAFFTELSRKFRD